jgi:acyl carrier protein
MAKYNFEKKVKETIQEREIIPSKDAWNAIEKQLETEIVSKKNGYLWYGVAAAFIGILLVSVIYISLTRTGIQEPATVVNTAVEKQKETIDADITEPIIEEQLVVKETPKVGDFTPAKKEVDVLLKEAKESDQFIVKNDEVILEQKETILTDYPETAGIGDKIAEVVAKVNAMEQMNGTVDEVAIDSLLRQAQMELFSEQIIGAGNSVDAMALLSEVEEELNISLRDQLFEKLKDGYLKVRTAVAYRNN